MAPAPAASSAKGDTHEVLCRHRRHQGNQRAQRARPPRRRDDKPVAHPEIRSRHRGSDQGDLRHRRRPGFGRSGGDGICRDDARGRCSFEDRRQYLHQGSADLRRPEGMQGNHRRWPYGQRHALLFGKPGAACGESRRDFHFAIRWPHRRHRRGWHGADRRDQDDLR